MHKVFILDDDEVHNDLSVMMLQVMGITDVECRTSGRAALSYLQECKNMKVFPDIMLIDLNLPVMNGFTFIKRYEAEFMAYNPDCRIIVLSNSVMDEERFEALKFESISDFWSKPLTRNKIQKLI